MEEQLPQKKVFSQRRQKIFLSSVFLFVLLSWLYLFFHTPPKDFPLNDILTISSGESLQSITTALYDKHIIRSPFWFRAHVIVQGGEKKIKAGDYLLDYREGPADLSYRLVHGKFHLDERKITIPEGWNIFQIGDYLQKTLINFNKKEFLALAKTKEGYLFPDTYFVSPVTQPKALIERMKENFNEKISDIAIASSTHPLRDIIIISSILENEARTMDSRRVIAGILWKRLAMDMPLQVDSTFSYINGKNTYELTLDDLKINSPYNTYLYKGLPPGPIGNPGMDAIIAAITPIKTNYLYFLSSKSGDMYYARTFEQHKKNKELYLNK